MAGQPNRLLPTFLQPVAASTIAAGGLLTAKATGASGRVYEFQMHAVGTTYHDRSGVYAFARATGLNRWDALYWGETGSFARRLSEQLTLHHKWGRVVALGVTHIGTLHVPGDLATRESIETDLRLANPTPCNDQ